MKSLLRTVVITSCMLLLSVFSYSQSSFSTAKIDDGDGCSWPFSSVAEDPSTGDIYGFWRDGSSSSATYKLIKWGGSSWSTVGSFGISAVTSATTFDLASDDVSLAIDNSGNFHIAFRGSKGGSCCSQPRGIVYGYSTNGTSWTFTLIASVTDPSGWKNYDDASIKVDKNGNPHIVAQFTNSNNSVSFMSGTYNRLYAIQHFEYSGSSWSNSYPYWQGGASNEVNQVSFDLDTNGRAHIAFVAETNGSGRDGGLFYVYDSTGTVWSDEKELIAGFGLNVSPWTSEYEGYSNDIAIDPLTNKVYIVSTNWQGRLKMTTNSSGTFSTSWINGNVSGWSGIGNFNITASGTQFIGYWETSSSRLKTLTRSSGSTSTWTVSSGDVNPGGGANFMSSVMSDAGTVMFLFDKPPSGSCGSSNPRELHYGTGTISSGCTAPSTPTLSLSSSSICAGGSTTVSIATGSLNGASTWKAYSGANGTGTAYGTLTGGTPSLSVSPSGTGTKRIYVRGEGCTTPGSDGFIDVTVTANQSAAFSYASSSYCANGSDPTPTITGNTGGTFSSTAGLSITGSTGAIDVSASTPGTYTVTYTNTGSCGTSATQSVTITAADNAAFNYGASSYCVSASDPTPTITGLTGGTFSSTAGLSITGASGAIDVSASTPGTYTVTYTTAGTCPNSSTQSVTINALDNAAFNYGASSYCVSASDPTPTITGLTGGTFSSTAGLSITGASGAIDVSASTPGTYTVTYTTAGTCPNSSTQSVTIIGLDDASFSYSASSYCVSASDPTPTAATAGTYSSTAGLSINGTSGEIDVSASTPGTYTVTHITTGSCPNSSTQSVTIIALDDASFSYSASSYCVDDADPTPTITGLTGGSFSSTAGLSITGASGLIDVSASTPGTYTVTYTTAGTCPNSSTQSVTINALDVPTFSYGSAAYCDNESDPTPTITGTTGGGFSSTAGLSISSSTGTIDLSASTAGTYVVTYTTTGPCPKSSTVNVTVKAVSHTTISETAYETYTSPSGKTWTTSRTEADTLTNAAGCDSIITVNLTIINRIKSWGPGFTTLDDVFNQANAAAPNDAEIWVREGTYYPGGQSSTRRDSAYVLTNPNTTILGGFAGNETEPGQRNATANQTILCGDIGTPGDSSDNAFHVLVVTGTNDIGSGFVIDGLVIRDANADGNGKSKYAGVDLYHNEGGGLSIVGNKTGLELSPTITNCQFDNNTADYGGAIYIKVNGGKSFANITNNTFKNGASTYGAIYNDGQGGEVSPNIVNCVFDNNTSQTSGAAVYNYGYGGKSSPTITSCVFNNNRANSQGGAIYNNGYAGTSSPVIFNATFHDNDAGSHAGAMYSFGNSGTCQPKVTNSIFYKNTIAGTNDDYKFSEFYNFAAYPYVSYSSLQRGSSTYSTSTANSLNSGPNNYYQTNPNFEDIADGDGADNIWRTGDDGLRLSSSSSLLNTYTFTPSQAPATDILGNQRMGKPDKGAYEYVNCGLNVKLATSVKTHQATQSVVDGGFVCYCNSDNELLLALDTNGTGAVITPNQVHLYIGNPSTLSYNSAGGMITNTAGGVILERRWDVEPTTQPTSPVRVRYFYTNNDYNDIVTAMAALTSPTTITSPSQLQFYKVTGGSTDTFPNPHDTGVTGIVLTNSTTASTTTWVNGVHGVQDHTAEYLVSSFSGGGGGGGGGSNPLPVELIQFDAHAAANHTADLTWKTASELNNSHFVIERSYNGRDFEDAGIVQGNGTTQNVITYNHNDNTIELTQHTVFYRLRQVDFDGTKAYSTIRRVEFNQDITPNKVSLYPNPTKSVVTITFNDDQDITHSVKVIDNLGRVLYKHRFEGQGIQIDLSDQSTGIYFIVLDSGESFKVIKE